jgi:polygalacturonase
MGKNVMNTFLANLWKQTNFQINDPVAFLVLLQVSLLVVSCAGSRVQSPPTKTFEPIVNVIALGVSRDGITDATKIFQKAIDSVAGLGGGTVVVPAGRYLIDADVSVRLKSRVTLQMTDSTTEIVAKPTKSSRSYILMIVNATDVKVVGGKIIGERNEHLDTTGEWGMGIAVYASKNVTINGTKIYNCWGDGIVIGAKAGAPFYAPTASQNVSVKNVTSDNNRRQAITIGKANGVLIDSCLLTGTNGTKPMAGIDIEPDRDTAQNITIQNSVVAYNKGPGIEIYVNRSSMVKNVVVKNNFIHHNTYGGYLVRAQNVVFNDNRIIQNKYMPLIKATDTVNCVLIPNSIQ